MDQDAKGDFFFGGNSKSNISGNKTQNCQGGYDYWIVKAGFLKIAPLNTISLVAAEKNEEQFFSTKIFSNPGNGIFKVQLKGISQDPVSIKVYNEAGNLLLNKIIQTNQLETIVDLTHYGKGYYMMDVSNNNHKEMHKLIVQ